MTQEEAIEVVLAHVREWDYEDRGYDYSSCPECGWNTRDDRTPEKPLGHHTGCLLRAAINLLEAATPPVGEDQ